MNVPPITETSSEISMGEVILTSPKKKKTRLKFVWNNKTRTSGIMFIGQISLKCNYLDIGTEGMSNVNQIIIFFQEKTFMSPVMVLDGFRNIWQSQHSRIKSELQISGGVWGKCENIRLKQNWILKQSSDPKQTSEPTKYWLRNKNPLVLGL